MRHVHVVVVGCGRVGSTLALELVARGHTVTVVDRRRDAFHRLGEDFPGETLVGVGFDREVLEQAGIRRAGALAAVTSGDNSNILIARVAREQFGLAHVVARIYDPERAEVYERLGITTVASVSWTTERVVRRILTDDVEVDWIDPSGRVSLVEHAVDRAWVGQRYSALEREGRVRVVAVTRLGVASLPGADTVVQEGDIAHLAVVVPPDGAVVEVLGSLTVGEAHS